MFQFLRSKAKAFYWVIAASFIGFIFLAWGMDYNTGRQATDASNYEMGSVNGQVISAQEFDGRFRQALARMRQQDPDRELTANQRANLREQLWETLVQEKIMEQEIDRLGLNVTTEEIATMLKNDPPPELLAAFRDSTGAPDINRYYAFLADPAAARDLNRIEADLRRTLPSEKLMHRIVSGAVISEAELREAYDRQSGRAVVEYAGVLLNDVEIDAEPDESAIGAWYEGHGGLYHREAQARVQFIRWPIEPSSEDYAAAREDAAEIKAAIEAGETDFAQEAAINSNDATAASGGDLGTFGRNRMVDAFNEVAFALPVGQISDPVETELGVHLIEVLEHIETEGAEPQIHARQILLEVLPSIETREEIESLASDFLADVNESGWDETVSAAMAADSTFVVGEPDPVYAGRDIRGLPYSAAGTAFAIRSEAGDVSPILSNESSYYVVHVLEVVPAGPAPLEQVRPQVVEAVRNDMKLAAARTRLEPAIGALQMGREFEDVSAEFELTHAVTDTITASGNVPGVGYGTSFNMVALQAEVGRLVPLVETARGVFTLRTLWKEPFSEEAYAASRGQLSRMLLGTKQQQIIEAWFAQKMDESEIVDNRDAVRRGW